MTEVLSISLAPDAPSHFGPDVIRRSSSQTSFLTQSSTAYSRSSSSLKSPYVHSTYETRYSASVPSSAPSSPRLPQPDFSNQPSYTSTPSSSLSLNEQCDAEADDIVFPSYDGEDYNETDYPDPPGSPDYATSEPASTASVTDDSKASLSSADFLDLPPTAGDDTAVKLEPSRHVDYLSHNWKEEDIWSSWRHIVAKRKVYSNSSRLENASWRTWTKTMNQLKTVSPDSLNWMKDHDVTWLYGPLQTASSRTLRLDPTPPVSQLSRTDSFATKKPILKKRSLSEIMLQRSISSSTLMKQATDALRAQQPRRRLHDREPLGRHVSDFSGTSISETPGDMSGFSTATPSLPSSGLHTPSERRRIHFNDKVEQCIAINKDGDDHEDGDSIAIDDEDDSSDDGIIMMKPVQEKERKLSNRMSSRSGFINDGKTIAMLPSTTLKYRGDTPEPPESESKQRIGFWSTASKLSRSSSQETLKPTKPFTNFLLDDDEDDVDLNWQPSSPTRRKDGYFDHQVHASTSSYDEDEDLEGKGLRRTPSGMLMPYEDDEDDMVAAGLFGRVVNTVNTAKDIAHVIWNVGWRK